jgi:hypothetical protein
MVAFVPGAVPIPHRAAVAQLVSDADKFARLHRVQDKDSKQLVPFVPLPMQVMIFEAVKAGH